MCATSGLETRNARNLAKRHPIVAQLQGRIYIVM